MRISQIPVQPRRLTSAGGTPVVFPFAHTYAVAVLCRSSRLFARRQRAMFALVIPMSQLSRLQLLLLLSIAPSVLALPLQPGAFRLAPTNLVITLAPTASFHPVDDGDFFLGADGRPIRLWRVPGEVAVRAHDDRPPARSAVRRAQFRGRGGVDIVATTAGAEAIARVPSVRFAYPVLVEPRSQTRLLPTDELLIRLAADVVLTDISQDLAAAGLAVVGPLSRETYRLRLTHPKTSDPLAVARQLAAHPRLRWAAPNFVRELRSAREPNDPLFPWQQSLRNTGQNGAVAGADIQAVPAWDITTGTNAIIIAILDEGVDTNHPDLALAPGGWDFADDDDDPTPGPGHAHGTACAGIATARHNDIAVAGVAGGCRVLPIKITDDTGGFSTDDIIGTAIDYAAARADVLSCSWGGGAPSPFIDDAIHDAALNGRGGKGCPVFFAAGNSATTWLRAELPLAAIKEFLLSLGREWTGQYYIGFGLQTGAEPTTTNDTLRLDNVHLRASDGYSHLSSVLPAEQFEWDFWFFNPHQWWLAGDAGWYPDSTDTFTATGGALSPTAPQLAANQWAWLLTPLLPLTGSETLAFQTSLSFSASHGFYIFLFDASYNGVGWIINGYTPPAVDTAVGYPASHPDAIAVGASTDCDYRSQFSQYEGELDFVAPGGGGWNHIVTLDTPGPAGYAETDVTLNFGGTSAACPHAAGVAALLLSVRPDLTASQLRHLMRATSDPIGGVTYTNGTNTFYGYGRLNAHRALSQLVPDLVLTLTAAPEAVHLGSNLTYTVTVTNLGPVTAIGVTLTNLLPPEVTWLNAIGDCATNELGQVVCALGNIASNTIATVTMEVIAVAPGYVTNTAVVTAANLDANPSNNLATVISTVPTADLEVSQFAVPLPAAATYPVTFVMTVTNRGPTAASAVTLTAGDFVSDLGPLLGGDSVTTNLTVLVPCLAPSTLTNIVTVSAAEPDSDLANNIHALFLPVLADADCDGLPDGWPTPPSDDPDGDGLTNQQEFLAGTDPWDAGSAPRIQQVTGLFALEFNSVATKLYRVEFTDDLSANTWSNLTDTMVGTGGPLRVTDPDAADQPRRFYRVRMVLIP